MTQTQDRREPAPTATELVRYTQPLANPGAGYRRPWWDPRRPTAWVARRWRRSLQLRTVAITVILCALAELITGALLSARIADGLFQERFDQLSQEAKTGLGAADSSFLAAAAGDKGSTQALVNTTLRGLRGEGAGEREYVLRTLPGNSGNSWVVGQYSSDIANKAIPDQLEKQVNDGEEIFWESVTLHTDQGAQPGLAFGKRVQIQGSQDYSLYLVYNLQQLQGTLDLIHGVLSLGGILLLLVIGAIAWYVARRSLQPVAEAASTAEKLAKGALGERMHVDGDDEVARLGRSFNRMADSLAAQIVALESLSQMQQRFVSDVSHELRTPLTTVRMAAEVLHDARENFDPINRRSAELLYDQVERFQTLLNDLLEISRFDAGAASLDAGEWDLVPVARRVMAAAEPLANAAGTELILDAPQDPVLVEMDPRRVERIVRNLVMNAVEHGEGRPVEVRVAGDEHSAAVAVRDHGIGLAPQDVTRVFDRFWRKDPARARKTGGSGLGLSIAMQDARLHGGWLQAWGEPGQGSIFRLTLPTELGTLLTASPLPLAEPAEPSNDADAEAEAIDADDTDWFPRTGLVFQEAEEIPDDETDHPQAPVPGTLPPNLSGPATGSMPATRGSTRTGAVPTVGSHLADPARTEAPGTVAGSTTSNITEFVDDLDAPLTRRQRRAMEEEA